MIVNIDENVGRLLDKLTEWNLERDTLVIFMNDNAAAAGVRLFNAGMRGGKGTPWLGGIMKTPAYLTPLLLVAGFALCR